MTARTKYYIAGVLIIVGLLLEVKGFGMTMSTDPAERLKAVIYLFGGVIVGVTGVLCRRYYGQRRREIKDQQRIATETLAELGRKGRR